MLFLKNRTYIAPQNSLYYYEVNTLENEYKIPKNSSAWIINKESVSVKNWGVCFGKVIITIYGYIPPNRTAQINLKTYLPYINGCSTNNILPPIRSGDPCMQLLKIPAGCSEQKHHIHSTDRVVYVLSGSGTAVSGVGSNIEKHKLVEGKTLILHAMEPHHFETDDQDLIVVPMHIWSSTNDEFNHPMMLGTHAV